LALNRQISYYYSITGLLRWQVESTVHMNGHRAAKNAETQSLNQSFGATLSGVKLSKDLAIGLLAPDLTW
jgi:two-component system sensor histidine kinase ChvG